MRGAAFTIAAAVEGAAVKTATAALGSLVTTGRGLRVTWPKKSVSSMGAAVVATPPAAAAAAVAVVSKWGGSVTTMASAAGRGDRVTCPKKIVSRPSRPPGASPITLLTNGASLSMALPCLVACCWLTSAGETAAKTGEAAAAATPERLLSPNWFPKKTNWAAPLAVGGRRKVAMIRGRHCRRGEGARSNMLCVVCLSLASCSSRLRQGAEWCVG